jgi:hypothetical protein
MADAYQKACYPGSVTTLADLVTLKGGPSVVILNTHATQPLFLGGSDVSTDTGFRVAAGKALSITLGANETVYGRSGTSTVTVTAAVFRAIFPSAGSFG